MWTRFMDMYSGGGSKEEWEYIYIEAPIEEAKVIFYNRFGHNPERITCTCCGEDYCIYEYETLDKATYFERENKSLSEYMKDDEVLVITAGEISPGEREGEVQQQGYVWVD